MVTDLADPSKGNNPEYFRGGEQDNPHSVSEQFRR